jgi:hypothetical protein
LGYKTRSKKKKEEEEGVAGAFSLVFEEGCLVRVSK